MRKNAQITEFSKYEYPGMREKMAHTLEKPKAVHLGGWEGWWGINLIDRAQSKEKSLKRLSTMGIM